MNVNGLMQIAILAFATAAISLTTAKGKIFAPFREWMKARSDWIGELASCPYCTSHWVAIALVAIYRPTLIRSWVIVDFAVSVFVMVAIAAVISGLIQWLTSNRVESASEENREEVEQLKAALQVARSKLVEQEGTIRRLQQPAPVGP